MANFGDTVYSWLTWFASWYYWGFGIIVGLTKGCVWGVSHYVKTLINDATGGRAVGPGGVANPYIPPVAAPAGATITPVYTTEGVVQSGVTTGRGAAKMARQVQDRAAKQVVR